MMETRSKSDIFPFGRFKGQSIYRYSKINPKYTAWFVSHTNVDIADKAKHEVDHYYKRVVRLLKNKQIIRLRSIALACWREYVMWNLKEKLKT